MKILLVNNDSDTWDELCEAVGAAGHDVTPTHYADIDRTATSQHDLAILSGGWWYDDEVELLEKYGEELNFIRTSPIPILGICIGMQLLHVSLDRAVPLLDAPQTGLKEIVTTTVGRERYGLPSTMKVHKNHTRGVIDADPIFEVLAISPGHVEIIRHTERPMLGVQFHPEVGPREQSANLLNALIALIAKEII